MATKYSISILSVILCIMCFITYGNSLPSKILPNLTTLKNEAKNIENIASSGMKIRGISSLSTENDTVFKGKNENTDAGRGLQSSIPLFQSSLKNEEKNKGNAIKDWTKFRRLYSYDVENETNSMEILEINEGDSLSSGIPSIHTPLGTEVSKGAINARLEITIRGIHFGNKHNHSGEESIEEPNSSVDCSSEESSSSEECTTTSTTTKTTTIITTTTTTTTTPAAATTTAVTPTTTTSASTTTTTASSQDDQVVKEEAITMSLGLGVCAAVIIVAALGSLFFFRKRPSVGIKATSSSSSISQV